MKCKNCGHEFKDFIARRHNEVCCKEQGALRCVGYMKERLTCCTNPEPELAIDCEKCGNRPNLHSRLCKVKEPEVEK